MIRAPALVTRHEWTDGDAGGRHADLLELQAWLGDRTEFLDGLSLVPLMQGRTSEHRDEIMLSECTWQAKRGIRTRDWKYISCWDPGIYPRVGPELYDLRADPLEQHNLASRRPEVVADMERRLLRWVDDRRGSRPDPMMEVLEMGLPAVNRLEGVIAEDAEAADLRRGRHGLAPSGVFDRSRRTAKATVQG